jgi:hypothetical protein
MTYATAIYQDGYGATQAYLRARKTSRGTTYRWTDDRGFECDGLRPGIYSVAYQLRHARSHARFINVRED